MHHTFLATLLSIATLASFSSAVTINTPGSLVQCEPTALTWTAGTAPYYLEVVPGGQPTGTPLEIFPSTQDLAVSWMVSLAAGTSVSFAIKDATGVTSYSGQLTVMTSTDSSCIGKSLSYSFISADANTASGTKKVRPSSTGGGVAAVTSAITSAKAVTSTVKAASAAVTSSVKAVTSSVSAVVLATSSSQSSASSSSSAAAASTTSKAGNAQTLKVGGTLGALLAGLVFFL